jgi:hypothetical protein
VLLYYVCLFFLLHNIADIVLFIKLSIKSLVGIATGGDNLLRKEKKLTRL